MNEEFRKLVDQLPGLLERLGSSPALHRSNLPRLPTRGAYVFYEWGKAVYVGRSNRMRERILEHGRPGSDHYSATFAFRLAKEPANQKGIDLSKTSAQLEEDPAFACLFSQARERVSGMSVRVVEIEGPIVQTLFEVYAHMALRTEHNDFDTH